MPPTSPEGCCWTSGGGQNYVGLNELGTIFRTLADAAWPCCYRSNTRFVSSWPEVHVLYGGNCCLDARAGHARPAVVALHGGMMPR